MPGASAVIGLVGGTGSLVGSGILATLGLGLINPVLVLFIIIVGGLHFRVQGTVEHEARCHRAVSI